jgi:hypothetical protein
LEIEIEVKPEDEARKRIVDPPFRTGGHLFPIAVFFIDVGARFLARGAGGTLRVRRLAQAVRLGVDLLDEGDGAEVIAPGLARIEHPDQQRHER